MGEALALPGLSLRPWSWGKRPPHPLAPGLHTIGKAWEPLSGVLLGTRGLVCR